MYGPWRITVVSEGTFSQLRPVEATEGVREGASVFITASVTWKEPSVEVVDGARDAAAAPAGLPSPTLPPDARGMPAASLSLCLSLFALFLAEVEALERTEAASSSTLLAVPGAGLVGSRGGTIADFGIGFGTGTVV